MASDRDDELAHTATAPGPVPKISADDPLARTATAPRSGGGGTGPTLVIGETLGRYKIEREIGSGGMGVVYAAFDTDLERRVALKVLRAAVNDDAAQQRLLQEARAMARLAHPNVATVHEVDTARGLNFVAMELVEGSSLAEWLRSEHRSEPVIVDAFIAAGRGLAAAHAAGIIHRDFKPHNVLRSKTGRIAVTDFGLARETTDPMAITQAVVPAGSANATSTPSTPLAGLTMTGSVLGTPAYMAPEQWAGGRVTPATDQFAYCVAMWEALSGERPFRGDTVEMLRRAVELGPSPVDDSKIPRRLRGVLRRGLEPLAKVRWESMDALLAEIVKARRRRVLPFAIAGSALTIGVVVFAVHQLSSTPAAAPADICPAPRVDPATVSLDTPRSERAPLAADLETWKATRERACQVSADRRPAALSCLDGVLARLEIIASGVRTLGPDLDPVDIGGYLIDPAVCELPTPPRLTAIASPQLRQVMAAALADEATPGPSDLVAGSKLLERVKGDPCAVAWTHLLGADNREPNARAVHFAEAEQAAQQCDDDRISSDVATMAASYALGTNILGTTISSKIKVAEAAAARVMQPDIAAEIDTLRMATAGRADNLDEAIARGEAAMAAYAKRGRLVARIGLGLEILEMRELRGKPEDLAKIAKEPTEWRARVVEAFGDKHPLVHKIDTTVAETAFLHGDIVDAPKRLVELRKPIPHRTSRKVHGRVTNEANVGIAGVTVSAGRSLVGGGPFAALPMSFLAGGMRVVTTSETGEFDIPDGPDDGLIIAQLGDQRSLPLPISDAVTLVLHPTGRIEGTIDLRGELSTKVTLAIQDARNPTSRYEMVAPVKPNGSFVIEGVPRAKIRLFAAIRGITSSESIATLPIDVDKPVVTGLHLAVANQRRVVHIIVRSTTSLPIVNAQVFVMPGTMKSTTLDKLDFASNPSIAIRLVRQIELEKAPPAVVKLARSGDAFATVNQAPLGAATACAIGLPNDISDPDLEKRAHKNMTKVELRCTPIPTGAEAVVVDVPPWPRFD